nr:MAG TPA: hypothetical protein [Caudoviricetes sp.]
MICKIIFDHTGIDIENLLEKIGKMGSFMLIKGVIYFQTLGECSKQKLKSAIKRSGVSDCVILEITEDSLCNEGGYVADWAREYFTNLATKRAIDELNSEKYRKKMEIEALKLELAKALASGQLIAVPKNNNKEDVADG